MESHRRKQYTADFKREAVALVTQHEYAMPAATKNFVVHVGLLRRWKTELGQQSSVAFPGKGNQTPDHAKLHRLREKNRRLRIERNMLKKATAIFASELR